MTPDHRVSKSAALLVAALAAFLTPFMASSINVALPVIGREFQMSAVGLSWVATSYLLAATVFLVPFGRAADINGRKRVFLGGIVVYTASALLCALSGSSAQLIVFRALNGAGAAMIFGTGTAMLVSVFPPAERGKVLGLNVASTYLGLSLGPVLGGMLTQHMGWRSIFYVNVPLGVLLAALVVFKIRGEWADSRGEPFDYAGSLLYGTSLVAILYGFSRLFAAGGTALTLAGIALLVAFIVYELRSSHPVLHIGLFRKNVVFALSNLAALINYSATFAVGFLLSLYLQYVKSMSPQQAGLVLIAQPFVMALFSPVAGWLSDRFEPRVISSAGMALTAVGLLGFSLLDSETPPITITVTLMFVGLGFALFSSPNMSAVMGSVERRFYGVASATVGTMRLIGQVLSMGISMMIIAAYIGQAPISAANQVQFVMSVRTAFLIFAVLCALGTIASIARGKMRPAANPT